MANYYETARTNYFLVKDEEAFKKECSFIGDSELVSKEKDGKTYYAILGSEEYGFPVWSRDDNELENEIDWADFFKRNLAEGSVAIVVGAGAERLRYVNGWAIAYNSKGETKSVGIDDIYALAESLGSDVTRAEY